MITILAKINRSAFTLATALLISTSYVNANMENHSTTLSASFNNLSCVIDIPTVFDMGVMEPVAFKDLNSAGPFKDLGHRVTFMVDCPSGTNYDIIVAHPTGVIDTNIPEIKVGLARRPIYVIGSGSVYQTRPLNFGQSIRATSNGSPATYEVILGIRRTDNLLHANEFPLFTATIPVELIINN